jgi:hypothetical protein
MVVRDDDMPVRHRIRSSRSFPPRVFPIDIDVIMQRMQAIPHADTVASGHLSMTSSPPSGLVAPVLIALILLALLAIAERVGLAGILVKSFFFTILVLTLLAVLWLARTTQERFFLGVLPALDPLAGAMVLAIVTSAAVTSLVPSSAGPQWLGSLVGSPVGLLLAHGLARRAHRRKRAPVADGSAEPDDTPSVARGVALLLIGAALAVVALDQAHQEMTRLLSLPTEISMTLASGLALLAVLAGGLRASIMQAALLALATVIALILMLAIGLVHLGALPLPGLSETTTLTAIAEARGRWAITTPLQLLQWPEWSSALRGEGLKSFALSALIASGVSLAVSPGLAIRRRSLTGLAMAGSIILPLVIMAIAGYAIEAAASSFVGASIARPPAALVESARLGLVGICGASPDTAEVLRMACGVSPRDTAALTWGQISLTPAFLHSGLSAAFGYTAAVSMTIGVLSMAWMMAMATLGLAMAANGLGLHVLARKHQAAGLASLRLGLVRLAALVLAVAFTIPVAINAPVDGNAILAGLAIGCGLLLALGLRAVLRKTASQAVVEAPAPPVKSRKRKSTALTGGEPA